jgi:hypothetical protein
MRFWRPPAGRRRLTHENFFVAKIGDSASARKRFLLAASTHDDDGRASIDKMQFHEMPLMQAFPALLTNADVDGDCTFRIVVRTQRRIFRRREWRAGASLRQHFLKRDTVFFDVLVYSGCCASRFPSARSEVEPSHILEGNMAKKAKKAKKAKSAVKKTAKKTRKVAKKKK